MTLQQDAAALTLPAQVTLDTLNDERLRVREPIAVTIFRDEQGFILAEAVGMNEFGCGDNPDAAVTDLQYALAELYFILEGEQSRLGPLMRPVWAIMQSKVEKG